MARWKARVEFLLNVIGLLFTARRNARIASAVLAIAIPSVRLSVRHTPLLSRRRQVARCSLHCLIKNVSSFAETKKYSPGTTSFPEILAPSDLHTPEVSEF